MSSYSDKPRTIDVHTWREMNRKDTAVKFMDRHEDERYDKALEGNSSNITIEHVGHVKCGNGYKATQLFMAGGLNGPGKFEDYFMDMSNIVAKLRSLFGECADIRITDFGLDDIDDMFYPVVNLIYSYAKMGGVLPDSLTPDEFYEKYVVDNMVFAGLPSSYMDIIKHYRADAYALALASTAESDWYQAECGVRRLLEAHGLDGESW